MPLVSYVNKNKIYGGIIMTTQLVKQNKNQMTNNRRKSPWDYSIFDNFFKGFENDPLLRNWDWDIFESYPWSQQSYSKSTLTKSLKDENDVFTHDIPVPGVTKDEIKVRLGSTIKGYNTLKMEYNGDSAYTEKFERTITFKNLDENSINVSLDNGLLHIEARGKPSSEQLDDSGFVEIEVK